MTPIFGRMVDRKGKAASIMFLGSAMLIGVHFLFAIPLLSHWLVAFVLMLVLGVAFSLVPSAMWPSVPKLIPEKQLGTAYALIFYIQNWGLMGVPLLIGWILDRLLHRFAHRGCRRFAIDRLQLHDPHADFHGFWYPRPHLSPSC